MPTIQIMSESLANKIAAGEVVERPASVVKELVENSIDAGSTAIEVYVEEGGINLIKVVDNGKGMDREDVRLSLERHATSKLKQDRDLFNISTLGFRGEALPSIAAVSKLEMLTWDGQEAVGTRLKIEGGRVTDMVDAPLRKGTILEVRDLFYNTPARYKYLRTIHTELGQISDVMNRLAMAEPSIAFKLFHNQKAVLATPGNGQLQAVLASIYGRQSARQMLPFQATHLDFEVTGWISRPELTRSHRQYISLFMNGRYIKNNAVNQAILRAYHTLLPVNRYPIIALSLKMDPSLLDVNVHPAKLEVRLSKEKELLHWLEVELRACLQQQKLIPEPLQFQKGAASAKPKPKLEQQVLTFRLPESEPTPVGVTDNKREQMVRKVGKGQVGRGVEVSETPTSIHTREISEGQEEREAYKVSATSKEEQATNAELLEGSPSDREQQEQVNATEQKESKAKPRRNQQVQIEEAREVFDTNSMDSFNLSATLPQANTEQQVETQPRIPILFPLAQLHGTYILAQNEQGLYMIDQHAAQERIEYEYFVQSLNQANHEIQELLIPLTLECTASEYATIQENKVLLQEVGLFLEEFGQHSFLIRAYPQWFPDFEVEQLIRDMIQEVVKQKQRVQWSVFRDKVAMMMACKKSIKANHYLSQAEMEALLEKLRATSNPFTCPHGRPITVLLTTRDIEKMFKRVM